jgi:hypothetical protein
MISFLRALRRLLVPEAPTSRMKAEEVLAVARAYLEARGGCLEEPVYVSVSPAGKDKRLVWLVRDNADQRGGNAYLRVDDTTGQVLEYTVPGSIPR